MIRKSIDLIKVDRNRWLASATGLGIRRMISISKTKKITANKKNRVENGIRALFLGSNPHSKGEAFSRSLRDRNLSV